jgi:DNA-binding MarR family transcriptional regulator
VISEIETSGVLLELQRATHHTLRVLGAALAELGLTPAEINVLAILADGRTRTVGELGVEVGTPGTTLTGVLDRLERRGHLVREPNPADRRSFRLALTEPGRAAATRVRHAITDTERTALAGLSAQRLAGYRAVVAALATA